MNDIENVLSRIHEESNSYLKSVNALDLMKDAISLQNDIHKAIKHYNLPVSVIAGILTSETHRILGEADEIVMKRYFAEVLQERDKTVRGYMEKNFMKKEI